MEIIGKILNWTNRFYRQKIIREQYPMLTSLSQKEWKAKQALGIVYMLHHITKKNPYGIPTNEDLKVSPTFLKNIIIRYKKQGFKFVSLDEISDIISSSPKGKQPFISFTIDDGYLDNYTEAFPIFEQTQVPFTIFVATNFIDKKVILWWDILEDLILKNDTIIMEGQKYNCHTFQEKWDIFRILREKILLFNQNNLEEKLKEAFKLYDIDWYKPVHLQTMSWEQVKTISQHPLCTIGGHTVSHPALNLLDEDNFRKEVADGIYKIQSIINQPVHHFAYPYGSPNEIGEREFRLISEFNFKTIFLSYGGCITSNNMYQTSNLPRVYLHEQ